ncbi:uncharacterized protein LOC133711457 [Rosa rugosa]|uniref:uncharacterized protein LOC133711457 n=1 Tax=Rosa rugosa TaxID=74645 RepID=UPI002B413DB8|nr:uncharacterized protein LOC133711457 [Rosa rugosa]
MKILSWNSRGSAWEGFVAQTQFYVACFDVDILCILDTRAPSVSISNKLKNLPFDNSYGISALGQCGGLVILWKSNLVKVDVIEPHDRFIHCLIKDLVTSKSYYATFVYAYPQKDRQAVLWNDLARLQPPNNECWVLMGDFNIITSLDEKLGGGQVVTNYMLNFCDFLNNENLFSLRAFGLPYTWTNKHEDDSLIFERLDRACVNTSLLNDCPDIKLENLPIIGSDHGPICLTLNNIKKKKNKSFKFEAIWLSHKEFKPLVEHIWNQSLNTNHLLNFVTIAGQFSSQAQNWNKNVYGNLFRKLEDLNERSSLIQQQLMMSPMSNYLQVQDLQVREELLVLYKDEELFWAQKAKANWLKLGDRNTRFFQAQVNIRKKSNLITRIQDSSVNWATADHDIADILIQDFKKRFHLDNAPNKDSLNDFICIIEPCINHSDNELLNKQVTDEEILEAVKAIGPLKALDPDGLHASFYQNC